MVLSAVIAVLGCRLESQPHPLQPFELLKAANDRLIDTVISVSAGLGENTISVLNNM